MISRLSKKHETALRIGIKDTDPQEIIAEAEDEREILNNQLKFHGRKIEAPETRKAMLIKGSNQSSLFWVLSHRSKRSNTSH